MANKAIICIGSNKDRSENIDQVIRTLQAHYPGARFSTPEMADAVDLPEGSKPFLNLVAMLPTLEEKEELIAFLKELEEDMGRDPDDDEEGIIPMDLDLIEWNEEVVKPLDLVRPYVVSGLEEIDEL
ncbi:2-amino-4-hydroxy-6-hydroxymethyldihydropteridine diphosphokinase [Porphyromonas miyakawae]|jgi:hypothetical protein|uniref:2-amino-4-hydroxy-6-hydroxymethyldihydropteridine pyrophosphokinase n=1 Tax=Porphyromonas miyakawae TaxID=3137470 RepID=A0ABQ0E3E9_9PORP